MTPDDHDKFLASTRVAQALPELQAMLAKQERAVQNRAISAIRQGALTPDLAVSLWNEIAASRKLLSSLAASVKTEDIPAEFLTIGDK